MVLRSGIRILFREDVFSGGPWRVMKRCLLHLGMPKTASTSIQAALAENRSLLREHGWEYPEFSCPQSGHVFALHNEPLCRLFFPAHPFHVQRDVKNGLIDLDLQKKGIAQELDNYCQHSRKLIFSSEALLLPLPLKRIKKFFLSRGYEIEPIIYVRAPYSYRESLFQSLLKFSQFTESVALNHLQKPLVRFAVRSALDVFGDSVRLYPFNHLGRTGEDIVKHFFSHFLDESGVAQLTVRRENKSLSRQAVSLLGYIEEQDPMYTGNIRSETRRHGDVRPLHQVIGERFCFSDRQAAVFREIVDIENRWLREKIGAEFCDKNYTDRIASAPPVWGEESIRSLLRVLQQVPLHLQELVFSYLETRARFSSGEIRCSALRAARKKIAARKQARVPARMTQLFPVTTWRGDVARKIYRLLVRFSGS